MSKAITFLLALLLLPASYIADAHPDETSQSPEARQAPTLAHLQSLAGDYFPLASEETGRTYHIYVRLPLDYAETGPDRRYPVVYLLDGGSLFPMLAANHLFLGIDEKMPEAIIVGISYGSYDADVNMRHVDYMHPNADIPADESGAPAFHRFLGTELLPQIEQRYRADPGRRILFGQSRGGSFALWSALTQPVLFWAHIASNPSFSAGRDILFGEAMAASRDNLHLIVASGSEDRPDLRADALEWQAEFEARSNNPWEVSFITIEGGTHSASSTRAYRAGMRRLFNGEASR